MTKSKSSTTSSKKRTLPKPPCIYINLPPQLTLPTNIPTELASLLPDTQLLTAALTDEKQGFSRSHLNSILRSKSNTAIAFDAQDEDDHTSKLAHTTALNEACIKHGRFFVSVNVYTNMPTPTNRVAKYGAHHLELHVNAENKDNAPAQRIVEWLFNTLPTLHTLPLIPVRELQTPDTTLITDHTYVPIASNSLHPPDAKIMFVAVVIAKPVVVAGDERKVEWEVADHSGIARFHFHHRSPSSQYTWDWVLALEVGQKVTLPRMPCVLLKERAAVRVAKMPFRVVGGLVKGVGKVVEGVGKGVVKVSGVVSLGKGSEWVLEGDLEGGGGSGKGKARRGFAGLRGPKGEVKRETRKSVGNDVACEKGVEASSRVSDAKLKVFDSKGKLLLGRKEEAVVEKVKKDWQAVDEDAKTEKGSLCGSE